MLVFIYATAMQRYTRISPNTPFKEATSSVASNLQTRTPTLWIRQFPLRPSGAVISSKYSSHFRLYNVLCSNISSLTHICSRLYGVILSQSYTYFINRKRDPPAFQWIMLTVLILETLHTAFLVYATYVPLIIYTCDLTEQLKPFPLVPNSSRGGSFI